MKRRDRFPDLDYTQESTHRFFNWIKYYLLRIPFWLMFAIPTLYFVATLTLISPAEDLSVGRNSDNRDIVVSDQEMEIIETNYQEEKEAAFCLFGSIDKEVINVREIEKATMYSRSKGSVSFSCYPNLVNNARGIFLDNNMQLIGIAHTHPPNSRARLSDIDSAGLAISSNYLYSISGVYMEGEMNFFTLDSISYGLDYTTY